MPESSCIVQSSIVRRMFVSMNCPFQHSCLRACTTDIHTYMLYMVSTRVEVYIYILYICIDAHVGLFYIYFTDSAGLAGIWISFRGIYLHPLAFIASFCTHICTYVYLCLCTCAFLSFLSTKIVVWYEMPYFFTLFCYYFLHWALRVFIYIHTYIFQFYFILFVSYFFFL